MFAVDDMSVCASMHVCVFGIIQCACMWVNSPPSLCVWLRVTAIWTRLWDPDPIHIRVRYGVDTLAIRRPIHELIQSSVPVRVVKTRRRFSSKIASFHVSVCSYVIFLFIVASSIYILLVLFHVTTDIFYQYVYLYHFIRNQWASTLILWLLWVFIEVISCVSISSSLV